MGPPAGLLVAKPSTEMLTCPVTLTSGARGPDGGSAAFAGRVPGTDGSAAAGRGDTEILPRAKAIAASSVRAPRPTKFALEKKCIHPSSPLPLPLWQAPLGAAQFCS